MDIGLLTGWDYLVLLVAGISIVIGLIRGVVRTVFALGGWVAAFVGAPLVTPALVASTGMQAYPWVVLVVAFFVIFIAVRGAGVLLARLMSSAGLGGADRALGGFVGALRALLIVAALAIVAQAFGLHERASWQQALSRPVLEIAVAVVEPYLPARTARLSQR